MVPFYTMGRDHDDGGAQNTSKGDGSHENLGIIYVWVRVVECKWKIHFIEVPTYYKKRPKKGN
jgi:hypothetical protein